MKEIMLVACGGAVGSVLRYAIGLIETPAAGGFPIKTLIINVVGSFVIGMLAVLAAHTSKMNSDLLLLLKVGLCGGFTTFSTFALETSELLQAHKLDFALLYVLASLVLSVCAVFSAEYLFRT